MMMLSIQNIRIRRMNWERIYRIIETEGMTKSERKVSAVIHNAQCFLNVREEFGTFSDYLQDDYITIILQGRGIDERVYYKAGT